MRISDWSSDVCSSDLYLNDLMPKHPSYGLMKAELAKLRANNQKPPYEKIAQGKTVKAGKSDQRIPLVRNRMEHLGFMSSEERRVGKERVSTCRSRWSPDL